MEVKTMDEAKIGSSGGMIWEWGRRSEDITGEGGVDKSVAYLYSPVTP